MPYLKSNCNDLDQNINSHGLAKLSKPRVVEQPHIPVVDQVNPENLNKYLNELKSEYEQKCQLLEQFKSELAQNQQQAQYLEQAEQSTMQKQSRIMNTTSTSMQRHQKSFTTTYNVHSINSMKAYTPFMSFRVSITSNDIDELSEKMNSLINGIEKIYQSQDEVDLQIDILKYMKLELQKQKQYDHVQLMHLLPDVRDMGLTLETFQHAKFINQTRVNTALSGINKCKNEITEFNMNKADRLIQKRQELLDQEQERQSLAQAMQNKDQQLEIAKRRLSYLKRENESIKIEDIITAFFNKRNDEENLLNKLDILKFLMEFMKERKESNDFAFEQELRLVPQFRKLTISVKQSLNFNDQLQLLASGKVQFVNQPSQQLIRKNSTSSKSSQATLNNSASSDHPQQQNQQQQKDPALKKKERRAMEQTKNIKFRWMKFKDSFYLDEKMIIHQYEEVMIKNQFLNVSFDDMTSEKNKRKLLLEDLQVERDKLENQLLTSKKLMLHDLKQKISLRKQFRKKIFLFLTDLMIKISTKLDKVRTSAPQVEFKKLSQIVKKFIEKVTEKDIQRRDSDDNLIVSNLKKRNSKNSTPLSMFLQPKRGSQERNSVMETAEKMLSLDEKNHQYQERQASMSVYRLNKSRKGSKRPKKKYTNIADQNENILFGKVQEALRDYLNIIVNMDYIKVIVVGLKDLIEGELNQHQELQETLNFNAVVQNMDFNNRGLTPKQFYREYSKCQKLFQIQPRNKAIQDWNFQVLQQDHRPLLLFESRFKQKYVEIDDNVQEESFSKNQYKKVKEDIIKNKQEKELAIQRQEEQKKKMALITPASLRLMSVPTSKFSPIQNKGDTFKEINLKLQDFQKNEMKFLNKFVKECDDVSLKINRFTAAVMPSNEKFNTINNNNNNKKDVTHTEGGHDYTTTGSNQTKRSGKFSTVTFMGNDGVISKSRSHIGTNLMGSKRESHSNASIGSRGSQTFQASIQFKYDMDSIDMLSQDNKKPDSIAVQQLDDLHPKTSLFNKGNLKIAKTNSTQDLYSSQKKNNMNIDDQGKSEIYSRDNNQLTGSIFIQNKQKKLERNQSSDIFDKTKSPNLTKNTQDEITLNQTDQASNNNNQRFFSQRLGLSSQNKMRDQTQSLISPQGTNNIVLLQDMLRSGTSHQNVRTDRHAQKPLYYTSSVSHLDNLFNPVLSNKSQKNQKSININSSPESVLIQQNDVILAESSMPIDQSISKRLMNMNASQIRQSYSQQQLGSIISQQTQFAYMQNQLSQPKRRKGSLLKQIYREQDLN
ncbi:UNKNOWN [Stylonychia lemnae]|uniref:Uncharacterized protein n=1 Tax=Stylonychia lemnae TaxID=5949 RepID=A0A078B9J4_STYLE|nr:UNKNOWN [Stylonychia lemnae]|eukprot:CDW91205.1 UNKNOWN [Stylonychia lemnae]